MSKINITVDTDTMEVSASMDGRDIAITDAYLCRGDYNDSYRGERRKYFNFSITEVEEQGETKTHRVNHSWDGDVEASEASTKINYKKESKDGLVTSLVWQRKFNTDNANSVLADEISKIIFKK